MLSPTRADKRQRGRIHEHDREFAEQVAAALEQLFLDEVFDRARGKRRCSGLLIGREFLAQPGHGTVEVVQGQSVHARDGAGLFNAHWTPLYERLTVGSMA